MSDHTALRNRDTLAGAIFTCLGIATVAIGAGYPLGSTARMGPGFFPVCLGIALTMVGIAIAARSFRGSEQIEGIRLRPLVSVLGAVVVFAASLQSLGIFIASTLLVVISSFGSESFRLGPALVLGIALATMATVVFVWGLGMAVPVWPMR